LSPVVESQFFCVVSVFRVPESFLGNSRCHKLVQVLWTDVQIQFLPVELPVSSAQVWYSIVGYDTCQLQSDSFTSDAHNSEILNLLSIHTWLLLMWYKQLCNCCIMFLICPKIISTLTLYNRAARSWSQNSNIRQKVDRLPLYSVSGKDDTNYINWGRGNVSLSFLIKHGKLACRKTYNGT
jgi:hypothetical protein